MTPAPLQQELKTLDFPNDAVMSLDERMGRSEPIFASLFARHPDDLFIHRRYQDYKQQVLKGTTDGVKTIVYDYLRLFDEHPCDPMYTYLYARSLSETEPEMAIRFHEKALKLDPNFAWPHLQIATIHGRRHNHGDRLKHIEAFIELCPESLEFCKYPAFTNNNAHAHQRAEQLRKMIVDRIDDDALAAHPYLWEIELRAASSEAEKSAASARLSDDVVRLFELNSKDRIVWYEVLCSGYGLQADERRQEWARSELLNHFPQSSHTYSLLYRAWHDKNPVPYVLGKSGQYYANLLDITGQWIRCWREYPMVWSERLDAVTHASNINSTEIEEACDGLLASIERNSDRPKPELAPFLVARTYVERGIRLSKVAPLVESALEEASGLETSRPNYLDYVNWKGWTILADAHLKMGRFDDARALLFKVESHMKSRQPNMLLGEAQAESFWERMGMLAETEGRKLDALTYYQRALEICQPRLCEASEANAAASRARRLWEALGGTEEGWGVWTDH